MSDIHSSAETYSLGHTSEAFQRLLVQGQLFNPFTRRLLEDAGLRTGMRVLDVGCGPGDVSLIAAELVGQEGSVIGVDTNANVLHVAQARAQAASLGQVSFLAGDIRDLVLGQEFDAIVGRLILMHLREPTALLRQLSTHLRPGGLVAFQEHDIPPQTDATLPPSPLWEQAVSWATQVFQVAGVESRMGMKLSSTFRSAGLPVPKLRYEAAIGAGPEWAGFEVLAGVVRELLPLLQQFGIATVEDIGIETLAQRLRAEVVRLGGVARLPALVSAWTRIGES
jgi:2-polyprenyl-3-methyl-5-hydroxy-6-metoxy-1,4-benzoquinol methylase